ncbi:hypothetical protein C0J52_04337 [Blattella germanica]|nr:hypothetical protein C0J52_04337 [Blattella germanica]
MAHNKRCFVFTFIATLLGGNVVPSNSYHAYPRYPFSSCPPDNMTCNAMMPTGSNCSVQSAPDCASWTFDSTAPFQYLGSVKLQAYEASRIAFFPDEASRVAFLPDPDFVGGRLFTVINLTFADVNWTYLRLRFQQLKNKWDYECREYHIVRKENVSDTFYDCWSVFDVLKGTIFILDYEAIGPPWIERRKFIFQIPRPENIGNEVKIQNWIPFMYVDISEMPVLTARWEHFSSAYSYIRYHIRVFKDGILAESVIRRRPFVDLEIAYVYDTKNSTGIYHFEVTVESDYVSCYNSQCRTAISPAIIVGRIKLPVVLVVYTPSRASHVEAVIALVEYLRNYCAVEALLDRLDIDIFRNVDVDSVQLLKRKFTNQGARPFFFSLLFPYCTAQDIPEEAKDFRTFVHTKDLDKMLWYIHNDGMLPNPLIKAWITVGPKLNGGKSDLKTKGINMLNAMQLAEEDLSKPCKCAKLEVNHNVGVNDNETSAPLPNSSPSQTANQPAINAIFSGNLCCILYVIIFMRVLVYSKTVFIKINNLLYIYSLK